MMNKSIVPIVIAALKEIELDGETMERIINEVGMRDQMIKQLTPQGDIVELERGKSIVAAVFTKDSLIEYTRTIQERCKQAITEAIDNAGIEGDEYMELELDYNNTIQTNFDDRALIKEIESIIDDAFETDDDSVYDEATNVIQFMKKV
jgi:hypothetical protein